MQFQSNIHCQNGASKKSVEKLPHILREKDKETTKITRKTKNEQTEKQTKT